MPGAQPLGVLLLICGAIAALVWRYVQGVRRREALQMYCASRGWRYASEDSSLTYRWAGTPFGTGDRRRATNVLAGADRGRPFVAFDYQYDTESSDGGGRRSRTTHRYAVLALSLPTALPRLQVTPHGALGRAVEALGLGAGVELESEDFDRRFAVHAPDPKFASDVLTPRTMQALLTGPPTAWRFQGTDVLSWANGALQPVDVLARLATLHQLIDGIPSFIWHDNGVPGADPVHQLQHSATPEPGSHQAWWQPADPSSPAPTTGGAAVTDPVPATFTGTGGAGTFPATGTSAGDLGNVPYFVNPSSQPAHGHGRFQTPTPFEGGQL